MTSSGEHPLDRPGVCMRAPGVESRGLLSRWLIRVLTAMNAVGLLALACWLYFQPDGHAEVSPFLAKLRWWSYLGGRYVPVIAHQAESAASEAVLWIGWTLAGITLIVLFVSVARSRGRERSVQIVLGILCVIGWLWMATSWDTIRLRGQSAGIVRYAKAAREFASQLSNDWPSHGGDISGFGAFLAYPYCTPRTLLMLGDAFIPGTPLRVAAVERTPGEAIRFQLSGEGADLWLECRSDDGVPARFRSGLQPVYFPSSLLKITPDTFVVRYVVVVED